jgi:hypothetical protein
MTQTLTPVQPQTHIDARSVAVIIANKLAHAGYISDHDITKALGLEDLPSVEALIGGRRFMINVEEVPKEHQPVTGLQVIDEDLAQGVLF